MRTADLQHFVDYLEVAITACPTASTQAREASGRIFTALRTRSMPGRDLQPARLPVCKDFEQAIAHARKGPVAASRLADALAAIEPRLQWARRQGAESQGAAFAEGHANTMIIGPRGIEQRDDVWIGVSLVASNVTYPDHQHPPEEVYSVLSTGEWRQGANDWFAPGVGGTVYNSPGIVHAMRAKDQPLLAAWCLWVA